MTNGGGSISDMITQQKRGAAMAGFSIGPLLGPIIGPVIGGIVADKLSWRWVFWILVIISGVISSLFFLLSRETYAPVLLQRKTDRLVKETGNINLRSKLDAGLTPRALFTRAILRPFKLLAFSPICAICNIFVGIAYGYLYIMFTSITPLFEQQYGFNSIHAGLAFLGLGVGSMIGVGYFSTESDRYMKKKAKEAGELAADEEEMARRPSVSAIKPEYRLPPLRAGAILLPVGLFIYGWTAQYKVHWIVPIIGTAIMGIGNLIIFMVNIFSPLFPQPATSLLTPAFHHLVAATIPRRHVHHLRRLCPRRQLGCAFTTRRRSPARRRANVREARPGLGQQSAGIHRRGADSRAVAVYAVWRVFAQKICN